MDNLLQPYLRSTSESVAEHRLKELLLVGARVFLQAGISVQFSRLRNIEGPSTIEYAYGPQHLRTLASEIL